MTNGFLIWGEKIAGKGEDCLPIKIISNDFNRGILCVCDGMGGAGSTIYDYNNTKQSGAVIAANACKSIIEQSAVEFLNGTTFDCELYIEQVENDLKNKLMTLVDQYESKPSRIKSSLIKRFPTTIAGLIYELKENSFTTFSFWAGDSRCYELNRDFGLIQITSDDLKNKTDSFENLKEDSPMSNYINADNSFSINIRRVSPNLPSIIFTCTDGVFGFFRNPFSFEFTILKTLFDSSSEQEWKELFENEIKTITGDDFSLSSSFLGFHSFEDIKNQYEDRFIFIKNEFIRPFNLAISDEESKRQHHEDAISKKKELEQELWDRYKVNYQFKYE